MKIKIYTKSHNLNLLKALTKNEGVFTSKEKSDVTSKENILRFKDLYKTVIRYKEDLIEIIKFLKKNDIKKIASIGCNYPIKEYYISKKTGVEILCYDFDKTIIKNSKIIFEDKISVRFYDMNTNLNNIIKPNHNIDCIIFFESLYIFNDKQYFNYLEEVNNLNIKYVIDKASITPLKNILKTMISRLIKFPIKILLFKFFPNSDRYYIGKFHGYTRTKSALEKIYYNLNLKIIKYYKDYFFLTK